MAQGERLRPISEMCERHGVCLILCHHFRKRGKTHSASDWDPPELDDLSWAGFAEFARQWLLIGRRKAYEPGTGEHKLWLSIGGSAGHGGLWALDVDEGPAGSPRKWDARLLTPDDAKVEKRGDSARDKLLMALREFPNGETKNVLFTAAGVRKDVIAQAVLDAMVEDGTVLVCEITKAGKTFDGYKLAHKKAGNPQDSVNTATMSA
jgi:hypothetical protein